VSEELAPPSSARPRVVNGILMPRGGHNRGSSSGPEVVPPFWLRSDEHGIRVIDERVLAVAKENWAWAFWLVKKQLYDGARTADIVEDVAAEVSSRLRADAEIGRNLNGYFRTAMILRARTLAAREGRITYEGGAHDLDTNHRPSAPDWATVFENRLAIQSFVPYLSHPIRRILHYRLLDYSWKYIAQQLNLTEKQAKSRFYYGVRQAFDELLATQARRARAERNPTHGNG
jgi:DNA-directed RNA polymerase specialized sigma24 family protein